MNSFREFSDSKFQAVVQDRAGPSNETTLEKEISEEAMKRFTECTYFELPASY